MPDKKKSVFETLNEIDVNKFTEKKGNLTYLSWAHAYQIVKKHYPLMQYKTYENELGFNYHTDGNTAWVKVSTTIEELEHIEYLPVLDFKNNSIPKSKLTSMNVNTAIQRALTKSLARHGLGLYIYSGEDLPLVDDVASQNQVLQIQALITETRTDLQTILDYFNVKAISELSATNAVTTINKLEKSKQ